MADRVEIVVIGAGVIGAAVAQSLSVAGHEVMVLEAAPWVGDGITSRNSGVIHSGLNYRPGSLKAKTCIRGNRLLYEWSSKHGVPHQQIGKLVVAVDEGDEEELEKLYENAVASGAEEVERISGKSLKDFEPTVRGVSALWCRRTGIVDPAALTKSLVLAAEGAGATVVSNSEVLSIGRGGSGYELETVRGPVAAGKVINAAGLYADDVARMVGIQSYKVHPCRGDYFNLRPRTTYRHLLYPVARPREVGLGIHLTLDLSGACRLGPDAEYVDSKDDFSPAEGKLEKFRRSAERMFGKIDPKQLSYDSCGIRPKLRGPSETEEKDFVIREDLPGFVNLVGIDSPGLTAALAIAETVGKMI
ncbi:MAG: NAD(P)/FAD-dependent oxidoreductase [Pseudomonadota bacterium]